MNNTTKGLKLTSIHTSRSRRSKWSVSLRGLPRSYKVLRLVPVPKRKRA